MSRLPGLRAYMPAYLTFTEPLSQQQREAAVESLDLIKPVAERREACHREITLALQTVEFAKRFERVEPSRAMKKKAFRETAKKLRQAVQTIAESLNDCFDEAADAARRVADLWEQAAAALPVERASRRLVESKKVAVYMAQRLLTMFGDGPPGLTRDGVWHQLAETIYGDVVSFDYLRRQHKQIQCGDGA